jgi:HK97 family phage major capsid protein
MKNSLSLKEERGAKVAELEALVQGAKAADRDFTQDEESRQATLNDQIADLDGKIANAEKTEAILARNAAMTASETAEDRDIAKVQRSYSFGKAIQEAASGRGLTGLEAEMHQEARNQAKNAGVATTGNLQIPIFEQRTVGLATSVAGVEQLSTLAALVPKPLIETLGAQRITGVSGDIKFPKLKAAATLHTDEATSATASPGLDTAVTMSPERVGARLDVSNQTLAQLNGSLEAVLAGQIANEIGSAVDRMFFSEVVGTIANDATAGTTAALPTYAELTELEGIVGDAHALGNNCAYVTTPGMRALLAGQGKFGTGSGQAFIENGQLYGYNVGATNIAELSNATAGVVALVFGEFSHAAVCYWNGLDLLIDPYTESPKGITRMVAQVYAQAKPMYAGAFTKLLLDDNFAA